MRNPLCLLGRHRWTTEYNWNAGDHGPPRPYEVCGRPRCRRYRNDGAVGAVGTPNQGLPPMWGGFSS